MGSYNPQWYRDAFDEYLSTADMISNHNDVIEQGYHIPDSDGSRSSVFRNNAVLNNSFDEQVLRESLTDIYLNSSHKLVASNHDNTNFFKHECSMSDMTYIPSTNLCEYRIPWNTWIHPNERDRFKLSQFYRTWIRVEDILNNWDIFGWHLMLFINQKIYSEYKIFIDEQEITLKFQYNDYWVLKNYPVYIYKFDTNFQYRALISRELCENQWNWKVPVGYISDKRIMNSSKVMLTFNKISDPEYRKDGQTRIEVLGDNLEFVDVVDGYIDLNNISNINKTYIMSELSEWLWMSIVVPKFFHEYPIMLPVDVIHRSYEPGIRPVLVSKSVAVKKVMTNTDEDKQVYVDIKGNILSSFDGWQQMIRPIVLSDAYENPLVEPFDSLVEEVRNLRDVIVEGAKQIDEFGMYLKYQDVDDDGLNEQLNDLVKKITSIRDTQNKFYEKRRADHDFIYNAIFDNQFMPAVEDIRINGDLSVWFHPTSAWDMNFWQMSSTLITIPTELVDKYYIVEILRGIYNRHIWKDPKELIGKVRFQRPVEENDFWIFEYNVNDKVWRPSPVQVHHQFPDVYLLDGISPVHNRVFKAFFFYSDTMNVLDESRDISRPTSTWNEDVLEFHHEPSAVYRDIFMEKFYWMGIRSIYKGLLMTQQRWEVIEYIINNPSYQRFNDLFLQTMDPYFKLGLAAYLKSSNFEFPFDDAVSKMKESIELNWNDFKRITNFEVYLNKHWIPSYFDYIIRIMDDWEYESRLLKRPPSTFDMRRISPIILEIQTEIIDVTMDIFTNIAWVLDQLSIEHYNLDIDQIEGLRDIIQKLLSNMEEIMDFINNLNMYVYSIEDINWIAAGLLRHKGILDEVKIIISEVRVHIEEKNVYNEKKDLLSDINDIVGTLADKINEVMIRVEGFDMAAFMLCVNDLRSYLDHSKTNPDDISVVGEINEFLDPWSTDVKEKRNAFFVSSALLNSSFDPRKTYSNEEVQFFVELVENVKVDLGKFRAAVELFWLDRSITPTQDIVDRFDNAQDMINSFNIHIESYYDARNDLKDTIFEIIELLNSFDGFDISDTEKVFGSDFVLNLEKMLEAVSYIAGENRRWEAEEALDNVDTIYWDWYAFVEHEGDVFEVLLDTTEVPSPFLTILEDRLAIILSLLEYMDIINEPYVPDSGWPSYSEVFEIDEIEIYNGGFRHEVGDVVFIPKLGSYKVVDTEGETFKVKEVEDTNYRKTNFRDPCTQIRPYDSISSGIGSGFMVKAISSTREAISNDTIILPLIVRVRNILSRITQFVLTVNPSNNTEYNLLLSSIDEVDKDWNDIVDVFSEYVTSGTQNYMTDVLNLLKTIIPPSKTFIDIRYKVNLQEFAGDFEKLIHNVYRYADANDLVDEDFLLHDNEVRSIYDELLVFMGIGIAWRDVPRVLDKIQDSREAIWIYKKEVFPRWDPSEKIDELSDEIIRLDAWLGQIKNTITVSIPSHVIPIEGIVSGTITKIESVDLGNLPQDHWYRIRNVLPALRGKGYRAGDIIEIIPEIPVNEDEESLFPALDDVIRNDVVLFQVTTTEDGNVLGLQPLMDYALPYPIWGIRKTITRTGIGSGLTVDIFCVELLLKDSSILNTENPSLNSTQQVDDNDLFMFKFENIHDLNMTYEVFIGGRQVTKCYQRREDSDNILHPGKIDVVYVNANDVLGLKNSSIFIPADQYFVYRIDDIVIKDPGAGYSVGQDIFVDATQFALRLKVAALLYEPYKGISYIDMADGKLVFERKDPQTLNGEVITDSMNNIDDEFTISYYDRIPEEGIKKDATLSYPGIEFISKRFDESDGDDRNSTFMYPSVKMPDIIDPPIGDPDGGWYQGGIDPLSEDRWNRVMNLIPPTHPFIKDELRLPPGASRGEYQLFEHLRFHNAGFELKESWEVKEFTVSKDIISSGEDVDIKLVLVQQIDSIEELLGTLKVDLTVPTFADLPKHRNEWPEGSVGKRVAVESDETNNGHRMIYRIRTFVVAGFFVYNLPIVADLKWNHIDVDWMNVDWYPDFPNIKQQYPSAPWRTKSFTEIQDGIVDGKYPREHIPEKVNKTMYIHEMTVDDLSVFNWTLMKWEDLHNEERWKLEVRDDPDNEDWGFRLTFLEEGLYAYNMKFYWNKLPSNQMRAVDLKRNAVMDIYTSIIDEVKTSAINMPVDTGKSIRIRKLFPYEQRESFTIGFSEGDPLGYEMDFKLANYKHYKNQIHLKDIKIFNRSANRFEDILDRQMFEVRFKDNRAFNRGYETNTRMIQSIISKAGEDFSDGPVWGWNQEFGIHIFGTVTAQLGEYAPMLTFTPVHCPNPPTENIALEFQVYQKSSQTRLQMGVVLIEFKTEEQELYGDGYIHNVTNELAPVPEEFKVIVQYDLDGPYDYDIIISKTPQTWSFIEPNWILSPKFHIPNYNIHHERLYIITDRGRFPLINPSTGMPSFHTRETSTGTDVTFMNLYRRYEHLEIHSVPYPMRSVYVQRRVPSHGYINLEGKINKPLNKKYFEFWMNGRLLYDEVTIISPSKIILHGLKSLRNFEIIEVNRDPNEFFSDMFLEMRSSSYGRPFAYWNYETYLDKAIEGTLPDDNYSLEEQEYLLSPVWNQVEQTHPSFKDYPPNVDEEDDIIQRIHVPGDMPIIGLDSSSYQFMLIDIPTLEGVSLSGSNMRFEQFGFKPITDDEIADLLNDEWVEEINNPNSPIHEHVVISDDEWYGTTARLYDELGELVHTRNEAAYKIYDFNSVNINSKKRTGRIVRNNPVFDLN